MNVSYKVWNYFFLFGLLIFFVERVREKERIFSFFERDYMFYTLNLSHRGNGESVIIQRFKNGSHSTIHTFKNYFATVFSVFSKISGIQTDPID